MNPNMGNALIWWVNQDDIKYVSRLLDNSVKEGVDHNLGLPFYLVRELRSAFGRAGRGRIWASYKLGLVRIDPWPKTVLANILSVGFAGIPFWLNDYEFVKHFPGIFTRLDLSRVWPSNFDPGIVNRTSDEPGDLDKRGIE